MSKALKYYGFAAMLSLVAIGVGHAQDVSAPTQASPTPGETITEMAPLQPPLPPEAMVMSVQCAVPPHEIATPAPLPTTVAKLQSGKKLKILAIGSAAVQALDRTPRNDTSQFAGLLSKVLKDVKIEIVNRGVSGETAATSARRLINEAAMIRPDLVLWQVGTTDAVARVPLDEFLETVRATVRKLRDNKIDVVLVGLQYTPQFARDEHYYAMRIALNDLANSEQLLHVRRYHVMDFLARTKANMKVLADTDFSMNELGPQCMAEHVAQALIANVFLRRARKPGSKS
jgi:acyl-CoA thioesterase-1